VPRTTLLLLQDDGDAVRARQQQRAGERGPGAVERAVDLDLVLADRRAVGNGVRHAGGSRAVAGHAREAEIQLEAVDGMAGPVELRDLAPLARDGHRAVEWQAGVG